jgi:hypothetical protein
MQLSAVLLVRAASWTWTICPCKRTDECDQCMCSPESHQLHCYMPVLLLAQCLLRSRSAHSTVLLSRTLHGSIAVQQGQQDQPVAVSVSLPLYAIWGAGTGVGKTLASVGLARAAQSLQLPLLYLKPVQTGFPADSDARLVVRLLLARRAAMRLLRISPMLQAAASGSTLAHGEHAAQLQGAPLPACSSSGQVLRVCKVLHAWTAPVGPHLAMQLEGGCQHYTN